MYCSLKACDVAGKMFKCVELPWLVQFFLMFYNDKPVDWLLDHLIHTKICSLDKDSVSSVWNVCSLTYLNVSQSLISLPLFQKHCKKAKSQLWIHYKPSLFQHIGTHSSLKGKVQKLKVRQQCSFELIITLSVLEVCVI
jgi:alpha-1,3-mannosylglycoprotein beta-1,4-N-acetylglucosaminyltransferase A/B